MNILDLGLSRYNDALKIQLETLDKRINSLIDDTLIVTEHFPVVTLGRLASEDEILDRSYLETNNIEIVKTNRGGKITYHGPGQLVIYPVIDLSDKKKDVDCYLRILENIISHTLFNLGLGRSDREDRTGVWIKGKKIAFIGIAIKKWVTYHGISVNINNNCFPFSSIVPCGGRDIKVVAARELKGSFLDMDKVKKEFIIQFNKKISDLKPAVSGKNYESAATRAI